MARPTFKTVREYLAAQPPAARAVLARVRTTIRKAVPAAEEVIAYQIPAYKVGGQTAIFFAGFKQHFSLYPANARLVEAFGDDLAPYEVNGRGTIRFPLSEPVPVRLIARIAKFRAKEAAAAVKAKAAKKRR